MFNPYEFGKELKDAHLSKVEQSNEDCLRILEWAKKPSNLLVFTGNAGTGKSYLCSAWLNYLKEMHKNPFVRVYSEQHFFSELKNCMQLNWDPSRRIAEICECDYLILDDMCSSTMTEWQKEMLFDLINMRYSSEKPTMITSNFTKKKFRETFPDRFFSRLFSSKNTHICLDGEDRRNPG